jgi:hypothetical protein
LRYSLYKNEYRIFKPVEATPKGYKGRKKKNRGNEPIQVIYNTYTHGNVTRKLLV